MGGGSWSSVTYDNSTATKIASGSTFAYTRSTASAPRSSWTVHEDLDPKAVCGSASPFAGRNIRESRDSDDHPTSVPLAVFFDETGSMGNIPRVFQEKLAGLFGLLLRKGYVEHPQIMVGGYGDAEYDTVPFQVSQFESDNRIDDALDNIFLEGNGGGNGGESMALAWYWLAHHTATDSLDKRNKKGYAFCLGDETTLKPTAKQISKFIGDDQPAGKLDLKSLVEAAQEKWELYVLVVQTEAARYQKSNEFYKDLLGERAIVLQDEEAVAETIALIVGMLEGTIDLEDGVDDLKEIGSSESAIKSASTAVANLSGRKTGLVVTGDAPAGLDDDDADDVSRV